MSALILGGLLHFTIPVSSGRAVSTGTLFPGVVLALSAIASGALSGRTLLSGGLALGEPLHLLLKPLGGLFILPSQPLHGPRVAVVFLLKHLAHPRRRLGIAFFRQLGADNFKLRHALAVLGLLALHLGDCLSGFPLELGGFLAFLAFPLLVLPGCLPFQLLGLLGRFPPGLLGLLGRFPFSLLSLLGLFSRYILNPLALFLSALLGLTDPFLFSVLPLTLLPGGFTASSGCFLALPTFLLSLSLFRLSRPFLLGFPSLVPGGLAGLLGLCWASFAPRPTSGSLAIVGSAPALCHC